MKNKQPLSNFPSTSKSRVAYKIKYVYLSCCVFEEFTVREDAVLYRRHVFAPKLTIIKAIFPILILCFQVINLIIIFLAF